MTISARFHAAVSNTRPRGARVIEAYSPKLGRRLQCFGESAFRQCICLEADPSIVAFCERPTYVHAGAETWLADFWAASQDSETLLVLDTENSISTCTIGDTELTVRNVSPVELAAACVWIENWERMLPVITACRSQLTFSLLKPLLKFIDEPIPLGRIEQQFVTGDPTLVRAAVFSLLHQGQLQAPQLQVEPLSYLTFFQPGRAAP